MLEPEIACYEWVRNKAAYQVQLKFKINKAELHCLYQLEYFLAHKGRSIISLHEYIDSVTANIRASFYIRGYLKGLIARNYLGSYEYYASPDSMSIGISDLGFVVLEEYKKQVNIIALKYPRSEKNSPRASILVEEPKAVYKIRARPQ